MMPMRALTLTRPMDWAVVHLGKPIENRDWPPPGWLIGKRFAIHAGQAWDDGYALAIRQILAAAGIVYIGGLRLHEHLERSQRTAGAVIGTVRLVRVLTKSRALSESGDPLWKSPWFFGEHGWVLDDVIALPEPVPCRGFQKLWTLPPDVEARVLSQRAA
jgi:hypothetical protein